MVVQRRQRNVQKRVMRVQSCCFANLNLLFFWRSRCRYHCHCVNSLLYIKLGQHHSWFLFSYCYLFCFNLFVGKKKWHKINSAAVKLSVLNRLGNAWPLGHAKLGYDPHAGLTKGQMPRSSPRGIWGDGCSSNWLMHYHLPTLPHYAWILHVWVRSNAWRAILHAWFTNLNELFLNAWLIF